MRAAGQEGPELGRERGLEARGDPLGAESGDRTWGTRAREPLPDAGLLLKGAPDTSSASRQLLYTRPHCEKDSIAKERMKQKNLLISF